MKIRLLVFFFIFGIASGSSAQCTAPNTPLSTSLVLNTTDTQLTVYFDTTANSPATNIYYLGIYSTNASLSSGPVNGTIYNAGDALGGGTVMFYGKNYIYKQTGLTANTTYNIFVYAARTSCIGEPTYSATSITAAATTFNGSPGIPAGYYDAAAGLTCNNLKTALYNIIKPTVANPTPTYTGIWSAAYITDDHLNDAGTKTILWDQYSDNPTGAEPYEYTFGTPYQDKGSSGTSEGQRYNREHTFPQAWFGGSIEPMFSDMFIVYPSDKKVNSLRANFPYGKVTSPTTTTLNGTKIGPNASSPSYTSTVIEPIDAYKGDLARTILYVATAYEGSVAGWQGNSNANDVLDGSTYPAFDSWYLTLLYGWHVQDPVSTKETDRNNDVYMIQGNRNPYIDHPEYVALVWQCTGLLPVTIIDLTAVKNSGSVLLKWYATFETNFKLYEVQRSIDGINFTTVGNVNGTNLANYYFNDEQLPSAGRLYYRIRMVDIDGRSSLSKTVTVAQTSVANISVYPNPATQHLTIQLDHALSRASEVIVNDITGRAVFRQFVIRGQKMIGLSVSGLQPGRYFLKIVDGDEMINTSFIVVK
ncbi:MAG TPA: endonuclease [Ferruginibacter sp.]|nr:endonuclease [Ferruginibacter sp.]